jgi:hypothetical protein
MEFKVTVVVDEAVKTDQSSHTAHGDLPSNEMLRVEIQRLAMSLAMDALADAHRSHHQTVPSRNDGHLPVPSSGKSPGLSVEGAAVMRTPGEEQQVIIHGRVGDFRDTMGHNHGPTHLSDREVQRIIDRAITTLINREVIAERAEPKPGEKPHLKDPKEPAQTHRHTQQEPSPSTPSADRSAQEASPQMHPRRDLPPPVEPTRAPEMPPLREASREAEKVPPLSTAPGTTRDLTPAPLTPVLQQLPSIETPRMQVNSSMPLEQARTVIIDKINSIRDALQTTPAMPASSALISAPHRDDNKPAEAVSQGTTARTTDNQREVTALPVPGTASAVSDKALGPQHSIDPTNRSTPAVKDQQRTHQLLDGLEKLSAQLLSINTLRAVDRALETVCLSVVAGGYLAAQGAAYIFRKTLTATLDIIARLREMLGIPTTLTKELRTVQESLDHLEKQCLDRNFEKVDSVAGFVGDITGRIQLVGSELPLEGITVDGGSLGTCITNSFGEFRFDNIPLDTGYKITAQDASYLFFPSSFVGTVATANQLLFSATKVS